MMATVKKFPNKQQCQKAQCDCGNTAYEIPLVDTGHGEAVLIECMKCHTIIVLVSDDGVEIVCGVDC